MFPRRWLYWLLLLLMHLLLSSIMAAAGKVPAIIVFGDSTVDAGNNNFIPTIAKSNFPPYGRDFDGGAATGRFSNGRLVTDFFSEAFGLSSSVPAYLDTSYTIDQLAGGVSFASGGTGLDDFTAEIPSVIPLRQQLEYFKEYKEKLKVAKGESLANEIINEALYIFSIGTNDFIVNYFVVPVRPAQYTALEYVTYLVGLADEAIRDLYDLGGRKIVFSGLAPFGCIPSARTLNHDEPGDCNEEYNQLARRFNSQLQNAVRKLNDDLGGAQVVYSDTYSVVASIVANPSEYGHRSHVNPVSRVPLSYPAPNPNSSSGSGGSCALVQRWRPATGRVGIQCVRARQAASRRGGHRRLVSREAGEDGRQARCILRVGRMLVRKGARVSAEGDQAPMDSN